MPRPTSQASRPLTRIRPYTGIPTQSLWPPRPQIQVFGSKKIFCFASAFAIFRPLHHCFSDKGPKMPGSGASFSDDFQRRVPRPTSALYRNFLNSIFWHTGSLIFHLFTFRSSIFSLCFWSASFVRFCCSIVLYWKHWLVNRKPCFRLQFGCLRPFSIGSGGRISCPITPKFQPSWDLL